MKSFITGWFGRATEDRHNAKHTMTHVISNSGICLCGYKPHKTMSLQWCALRIELGYLECPRCKEKVKEIINHLNKIK